MKVLGISIVILLAIMAIAWSTLKQEEASLVLDKSEDDTTETQRLNLAEKTIILEDGSETVFRLPEGFEMYVAASELGKPRFMALSPDGRLFVPNLVDYNLSNEGQLFILEDFNESTGQFETKYTYLADLRGPNSVAFYTDEDGQQWLYLALTAHLVRYPYEPGDAEPTAPPEIIAEFPNEQSPGEESVVWHITRTILFHEDRLYVAVGSGCNACEELAGSMRAMIYSMDPSGNDVRIEGEGLRNPVGIAMVEGKLYATDNGVDHLGTDRPDETMYVVEDGQYYGWPYCYVKDRETVPDDTYLWETSFDCSGVPAPLATFEPRSAPLGLRYFNSGSHSMLRNAFLVALHGSFEPATEAGYEIRRVTLDGRNEIFMDGFIREGERVVRPVDFLARDADSFFFTDDHGGRIFYVRGQN